MEFYLIAYIKFLYLILAQYATKLSMRNLLKMASRILKYSLYW